MVYSICRKINILCGILSLVMALDILILPLVEKKEKVLTREAEYYYSSGQYTGTVRVKADTRIMVSEHYRYPFESYQQFEYWRADSIRLLATPILREVKTGFVVVDGKEYELPSRESIFRDLFFVPIIFGLCSVMGVLLKNNKEQTINFGIVNVILFLILLKVMRIL